VPALRKFSAGTFFGATFGRAQWCSLGDSHKIGIQIAGEAREIATAIIAAGVLECGREAAAFPWA